MADQLHDIVTRMVAAGEPEENIALVIQHYKAPTPETANAGTQPLSPQLQPQSDLGPYAGYKKIGDAVMGAGKWALNNPGKALGMAGAAVGAAATAPASIPAAAIAAAGAGLGAAGGAGIGSIIDQFRHGPQTPSAVAKSMATEGALGAAGEGVGRGVATLAKGAGKLVYKASLRPSMQLQRDFGDIAATGIKEGAIISERGAKGAATALGNAGNDAKALVAEAKAAGAAPIRPKDVAIQGGMRDVNQRAGLRASSGLPDERPLLTGRLRAMQTANPNGIDILKAQDMKGELQDLASRVYRAQDKGNPVLDLSADTNAALARGLRHQIGANAEAVGVPGVHAANARTQELMGLTRALEDATKRNVPGVGSIRTLLGDFVPSVASAGGIGLDRAGAAMPAAFRTALLALFGGS